MPNFETPSQAPTDEIERDDAARAYNLNDLRPKTNEVLEADSIDDLFDELTKLKAEIRSREEELNFWQQSGDSDNYKNVPLNNLLLEQMNKRILALRNKIQDRINKDWLALTAQVRAGGNVAGSAKKFRPEETIIEMGNALFETTNRPDRDIGVLASRITRTNGYRQQVIKILTQQRRLQQI